MVYLRIKENSAEAKKMLEYLKMMPYVDIVDSKESKKIAQKQLIADIEASLRDVKAKRTKPLKDLLDGK